MSNTVRLEPQNKLLQLLPATERDVVLSVAQHVEFGQGTVVVPPRKPFEHVYFPENCVFSILTDAAQKVYIETGTVGCEGFVGIPAYLGAKAWPHRTIVQIPGRAHQIPVNKFSEVLEKAPTLTALLDRYVLAYLSHVSQTAACNSQHTIVQRCARWTLLTQDRLGTDTVPLTQVFLSYMLGVRRPSVTTSQAMLQRKGLIRYNRGRIQILDRAALEKVSCKCYAVVRDEFASLIGSPVG